MLQAVLERFWKNPLPRVHRATSPRVLFGNIPLLKNNDANLPKLWWICKEKRITSVGPILFSAFYLDKFPILLLEIIGYFYMSVLT